MAQVNCIICRGFGKTYPAVDNGIDYSRLIFCACQGARAFKTAHPAVKHPDIDSDIAASFFDAYDAARQTRYRDSQGFKQEAAELYGEQNAQGENPAAPQILRPAGLQNDKEAGRTSGWRELVAMKAEMNALRNKFNEHLDKSKKPDWTTRI